MTFKELKDMLERLTPAQLECEVCLLVGRNTPTPTLVPIASVEVDNGVMWVDEGNPFLTT